MKPLRDFSQFIDEGIVTKQSPDPSRAQFLRSEAKQSYSFVLSLASTIDDSNANAIVKLAYDVIMGLLRSKLLETGYRAHGPGAHEAEVAYLRELDFSEVDVQFCNDIRYFRNGIMYYGRIIDAEYGKKVIGFMQKVFTTLLV
jgi:hypothetical protein